MAVGGNNSGGSSSGIKAGSAYVTLGLKNFLPADLLKAQKGFASFGDGIAKAGRTMAVAGAAAFTPLIGAMGTLNDIAKQGSIAKSLGLTSEQFTGIAGVAKSVGNDTKEFIESLVTMGKLGTDAAAGTEQASQAFASMGLNANEFIKLRADEQFFAVFEALAKIPDPLTRVRVLMQAFGEDGGKILLPLLGKTGAELREMAKGFGISADDMKAATGAQQAYTAATSALGKAWQSVSIAAAPIVKIIAEGIAQAVTPFREFVNANREAVVGLSLAAGGVTAVGLGLMVLGPAIKALAGSWALFTGAVAVGKATLAGTMAVIAAPILLIPAGLAAAGAAWLAFTDRGNATAKGFAEGIAGAFGPTFENLKSGWTSVVAAVQRGDLKTAFEIGVGTIRVEWARLMVYLNKTWAEFSSAFSIGWNKVITATSIALVNLSRRLGLTSAEDASKEIKQLLQMEQEFIQRNGPGTAGVKTAEDQFSQEKNALGLLKHKDAVARYLATLDAAGGAAGGVGGGDIAGRIADIASRTLGGFGGSANVGMFGGGGVGEKIAENTKRTAIAVEKLATTSPSIDALPLYVREGT